MAENMKYSLPLHKRLRACVLTAACALIVLPLCAQRVAPRINSSVSPSQRALLKGSLHPLARPEFDTGRMAPETRINGMRIDFNRTPAQQAALNRLIAEQQDPASPLYHKWLTPDEFAARFGMAQSDLQKVESWLEQQGFTIDSVSRSRNSIQFSGTVRQVEAAFATEMHTYNIHGVRHFAPSTELSLPAAIAPTVLDIRDVNDFRPTPRVVYRNRVHPRPNFTSGQSGNVYFSPGDIKVAYNINPVYSAGYDGSGQKIALVGQSAISLSDIENFQQAAGLTVKDPTLVLVPGTGTSTLSSGDESESDLDLEWSGAIAPGAEIVFVYAGSHPNAGAFDAIEYAVDQDLAPIISSSYGECEAELDGFSLEASFQQAESQGQTVLAASGDDGSTDCYIGENTNDPSQSVQQSIAVDYPASSPYVTGMGGTEVSPANSAYLTSGTAYWEGSNGNDVIASALQYLPEVAWNDDAPNCGQNNCLGSSGGGASSLFSKPSWQTGVPGIPSDGKRDVPDLALYASASFPGYLYCTSDSSAWDTADGQQASCNSGFRDGATGLLTIAGGTSFAAPIFAGVVALINQKANYASGQGLINPTLYKLASDSSTYASAFHDITQGNNDCTAGSPYCANTKGFSAGTGYDQVTGLGSINVDNLISAWPASSSSLIGTTTSIAASSTTPALNASDTFTMTVSSNTGSSVPSGSVTVIVDSGSPTSPISLNSSGTASYTTSFSTAGTHLLVAKYSGDSTHAASTGTITVTVSSTTGGPASFALSSTNVTVPLNGSGNSTITVTPKNGYTGTVTLTLNSSNNNALQNLCWQFTNSDSNGDGVVAVSGTSPVSTQLTLNANSASSSCVNAGFGSMMRKNRAPAGAAHAQQDSPAHPGPRRAPMEFAFAGLFLAGFLGRYSRRFRSLACVVALAAVGFGLSACGGITTNTPPAGTYTITVTGQDTASTTIPTATTSFTFTIQ
jgi:subtilase family serine protease